MIAGGVNTNNMASQLDAAAAGMNTTGTDGIQGSGSIS